MSRIKSSYNVWKKASIIKILKRLNYKAFRRNWIKAKLIERLQLHSIEDVLGAALKSELVYLAKKLDIPFERTTIKSLIERITSLEPIKDPRVRILSLCHRIEPSSSNTVYELPAAIPISGKPSPS